VIGLGEVGGALAEVLESAFGQVLRQDLEPIAIEEPVGVMHVCIPFKDPRVFSSAVIGYARRFSPSLMIVNSTVLPGTSRALADATGIPTAYSPVRGKHVRMVADLRHYKKYVAGVTLAAGEEAAAHFAAAGMQVGRMDRPETLEVAKLAETTYFGIQIAFAQEINRYAERVGGDYNQAIDFFEEVGFLPPVRYYPGFIGGHCVMPNIGLLQRVAPSSLLEAIVDSNERRAQELEQSRPSGGDPDRSASEASHRR
jgi:UDP-N-acetyl-D-mannosaminuronate dehydrogenase